MATGCLTALACSAAAEDLSGAWSFHFDEPLWADWSATIIDRSGAVTGDYASLSGSWTLQGTHTDGMLTLRDPTWPCDFNLSATVVTGCILRGRATCMSPSSESAFTAIR